MKRLLLVIAFLILPACLMAADVTLQWDASPTAGIAGYAVYDRDYTHGYGDGLPAAVWSGTGLTCTVTAADDRQTAYVVRAYVNGVIDLNGNPGLPQFSVNSNEVVYVPTVSPPEPPVIVQIIAAIVRAIVNFFA